MRAPACVHPDLNLILRSIRDLFSDEVEKLVIDERAEFERVRAFVEQAAPELRERIELYGGEEPIFDEYGIEQELIRAQNRKVWLKSGGGTHTHQNPPGGATARETDRPARDEKPAAAPREH